MFVWNLRFTVTTLVLRLHPESQMVIDHKFPGYHVLSIHITLTVTYIKWFCVRKLYVLYTLMPRLCKLHEIWPEYDYTPVFIQQNAYEVM